MDSIDKPFQVLKLLGFCLKYEKNSSKIFFIFNSLICLAWTFMQISFLFNNPKKIVINVEVFTNVVVCFYASMQITALLVKKGLIEMILLDIGFLNDEGNISLNFYYKNISQNSMQIPTFRPL